MASSMPIEDPTLELARELVKCLEKGDKDESDVILAQLTGLQESQLFNELGKLTREFHEALNSFRYDDRINELAEDDIPDAKQRLTYVIERTDDAAHKTLSAVEKTIPVVEQLSDISHKLSDSWHAFTSRKLTPQQFRELSKDLQSFLDTSEDHAAAIKGNLNEVLLAQDFQDITGQIIKKVIKLVDEVEKSLVNLVRIGGGIRQQAPKKSKSDKDDLAGPVVPGTTDNNEIHGQDDVDALLSSLGF